MSEQLQYERGRVFLPWHEVSNRSARLLNEPLPYPPIEKPPGIKFWKWGWLQKFLPKRFRTKAALVPIPVPATPPPEPLPSIWWGGILLPLPNVTRHFIISGVTGAGKSTLIQKFFQSVVPHLNRLPDQRCFVYDNKRELYSRFQNMGIEVPVHLLDPFDLRGKAWRISADIRTPAEAQQVAAALVPAAKDKEETFWVEATRGILAAVIENLIELAPGQWTLRDALLAMRSRERLSFLLGRKPETAWLWQIYSGDERTLSNLLSSFASRLQRYNVVAALWEHAQEKLSLREWVTDKSVLIVPNHPRFREALRPVHQLLFDFVADQILSQPDSRERKSWFVLDEVRDMGRLGNLFHMANEGRSKGVALVLGIQAVEGLYELYGQNGAHEVLAQMRHKTFLQCDSGTAQWAEQHFGEVQWRVLSETYSRNHGGKDGPSGSTSSSTARRRESALLASEVMQLPSAVPGGKVEMVNDVPMIGSYSCWNDFDWLLGELRPAHPNVPNSMERPGEQQQLKEWTEADRKRLGLPAALIAQQLPTLPNPASVQ